MEVGFSTRPTSRLVEIDFTFHTYQLPVSLLQITKSNRKKKEYNRQSKGEGDISIRLFFLIAEANATSPRPCKRRQSSIQT